MAEGDLHISTGPTRSPPIGRARQNAVPQKFDPKPSEVALLAVFPNFDKCRPEVAGDVVSGVAVDWVGLDVCVRFGHSRFNRGRIIRLFAGRTHFAHVCAVFNFLNHSLEIPPESIRGSFGQFFLHAITFH